MESHSHHNTQSSVSSYSKPLTFDPKYAIPVDVVDDVVCRFLLNIPKEEKFDPIRVCFQIELAHWFFVDYYCGEGCDASLAHLHNIPYNQFAYIMFQQTPHLRPRLPEIDKHLAAFREYKMRVPTYGAILMNTNLTSVVLVQGFRNQWGFPKGKVNEVEEPVSCAIREVFEETGYDIAPLVNENHFIEAKTLERNDRLYLVQGVEMNFPFQPQTQFEIKNIKWFNIDELPEHKKDTNPAIARHGVPISNFFTVYPYVKRLKMWVADKLEGKNKIQNFRIKPDDNGEVPPSSVSTHRTSNKSNHSHPTQFPKPSKNQNHFQFQQQFLAGGQGGAGWQLFPGGPNIQNPYGMNSNAIHDLILNHGQLQLHNQHRQNQSTSTNTSVSKGNPQKNPRRRLFPDEAIVGTKLHSKDGSSKRVPDTHLPTISHKPTSTASVHPQYESPVPVVKTSQSRSANKKLAARDQFQKAPSWINFSFDRERVYKAFFTPSI